MEQVFFVCHKKELMVIFVSKFEVSGELLVGTATAFETGDLWPLLQNLRRRVYAVLEIKGGICGGHPLKST